MRTPLVRERSGVQSSLAAPSNPLEIKAFSEDGPDANLHLATERNRKTRGNTGKIRGLPFSARSRGSGPPDPEKGIPAAAVTANGEKVLPNNEDFNTKTQLGDQSPPSPGGNFAAGNGGGPVLAMEAAS